MDRTNRNTALASALAEELARCGVRHAVVSPGSRSTPLAVALARQDGIEVSVVVDERSAGFFALGAAQATGLPVALVCTSGTAAANYHPALAEGDLSSVPLLVLTADRPPELRDIGAGQTIDQVKLFGSSVRWYCEVGTHEADDDGLLHFRSVACRAFASAKGDPRPGPVHLNVALREPLAPIATEGAVTATDRLALEGRSGGRPLTAATDFPGEPRGAILDMLAEQVTGSETGVIVAGRHADRSLREPLAALAQAAGMPILADPLSQLRLGPHDRSHVVCAYDSLLREERWRRETPDLVLRFGDMPTSKPLRSWLSRPEVDQLVFGGSGGWNEPTHRAAAMVRGNLTSIASGLADRVDGREAGDPSQWLEADREAREAIASEHDGRTVTEPALHIALGALHRDGDTVYTASSMPIRDQEAFLGPGEADVVFLANRGANGIDGLIASGAGAAHASERVLTVVTGDLGFLHDVGSLATLAETEQTVRIIVIQNGGGRIFERLPQRQSMPDDEFERVMLTPRGLDIEAAARAFGANYRRVEKLDDLGPALDAGTGVIEVIASASASS